MAREGYAASGNAVYKVNQRTGEVAYEGEYGGRGGQSIRNSIQTVGARQAARTARAYRNSTSSARESAVPKIDFEGANDLFNRRTNRSERMIDSRNASNFNARMRAAEERWRRNNPNF